MRLPSGLDPFTGGRRTVQVDGATLGAVLAALDDQVPGLSGHLVDGRGRVRAHLQCVVDGQVSRDLDRGVDHEVRVVTAVSGG